MWSQRQFFKSFFVSAQWYARKLKVKEVGKAANRNVVSQPLFWNSVENCMRALQPLLKALGIVDGDEISGRFGRPWMLQKHT
jgi:hypothetical protein